MPNGRTMRRFVQAIQDEVDMDDLSEYETDFLANVIPKVEADEWITDKQAELIYRIHHEKACDP